MVHPKLLEEFLEQVKDSKEYHLQYVVGSGSYGIVFKALCRTTKQYVAIKKICNVFCNKKDAQKTLRETRIMRLLKHDNIVGYYGMLMPKDIGSFQHLYLLEELMDGDLKTMIRYNFQDFLPLDYKSIIYQILLALAYIHSLNIYHRDIKPSNILVNREGLVVKLCDFGLARRADEEGNDTNSDGMPWTNYVATRWYRAPEICGSKDICYTKAIDVWSLGCVFVEMFLGRPLFRGNSGFHQLILITNIMGPPPPEIIETHYCEKARFFLQKHCVRKRECLESFTRINDVCALDIMKRMLNTDPIQRVSAEDALKHAYFDDVRDRHKPFTDDAAVISTCTVLDTNNMRHNILMEAKQQAAAYKTFSSFS